MLGKTLASLAMWAPAMQMKTGKATGTCHWWLFVLGSSDHNLNKKTCQMDSDSGSYCGVTGFCQDQQSQK